MKLVWGALLVALAIAAASQQQPANHDRNKNPKPAIDYKALADSYFSFHAGEVRTYIYHGEIGEGPGNNPTIRKVDAKYTETVVSVRDIPPRFRIVQLEIRGSQDGADHTGCNEFDPLENPAPHDRVPVPVSFLYVFDGARV